MGSGELVLKRDTKLECAPSLELSLLSGGRVVIHVGRVEVACERHVLTILELFARPRTVGEAMEVLAKQAAGRVAWMDLTATILSLHAYGVLRSCDERGSSLSGEGRGFDRPAVHIRMLNDRVRTKTLLEAIARVVRPGDVVIDVGTGTGILAAAAAKAGARRVYAIECGEIGAAADAFFKANGLSDRVVWVRGWSTDVSLPERGDVFISETVGNAPFAERMLDWTLDARSRHLVERARFMPEAISVWGLPLETPASFREQHLFSRERADDWARWYGVDFSSLVDSNPSRPNAVALEPNQAAGWLSLGSPVRLCWLELATFTSPLVDARVEFTAAQKGTVGGILVYFDLRLTSGMELRLGPEHITAETNWKPMLWLLPMPISISEGDRLRIRYAHRVPGTAEGIVEVEQI